MSFIGKKKITMGRANIFMALGFLLLLALWQILSLCIHDIILASPAQALRALWEMIGTPAFDAQFWITLRRIFLGVSLGGLSGFILGIAAGLNEDIKNILAPLRWLLLSISPVVLVVMAMLWFGMGSTMVVFITSILVSPIVYVNTVAGIEMVDESLVEMARFYKFDLFMLIRHVYTPAIIRPLSAGMVLVTCMGARVVLLAEILGANEGIGYSLGVTRSNMETPQLFAWVVVSLAIVGFIEFLILRPAERHFMRWAQ